MPLNERKPQTALRVVTKKSIGTLKISGSDAYKFTKTFFDNVVLELREGRTVHVAGIGVFDVTEDKARTYINRWTMDIETMPAVKRIRFKMAAKGRAAINAP